MTSLAEILHNIADHAKTLWQLSNEPAVPAEFADRLKKHILLEELENTEKLQQLQTATPSALINKLIDHSYFIQQLSQAQTISLELQQELLHHFMEEHQEWQGELSASSGSSNSKWTVGPLWPQGG